MILIDTHISNPNHSLMEIFRDLISSYPLENIVQHLWFRVLPRKQAVNKRSKAWVKKREQRWIYGLRKFSLQSPSGLHEKEQFFSLWHNDVWKKWNSKSSNQDNEYNHRTYAIHNRTKFSNFILFSVTISQVCTS